MAPNPSSWVKNVGVKWMVSAPPAKELAEYPLAAMACIVSVDETVIVPSHPPPSIHSPSIPIRPPISPFAAPPLD